MDFDKNISLIKACLWQLFPNGIPCSIRLLEWNAPPAHMRQCALSLMEDLSLPQRTALQLICFRLHALANSQDRSDSLFELTAQVAHLLFVKTHGGKSFSRMQRLLSGVRVLLVLSDMINEIPLTFFSPDVEYGILQSLSQALMQVDAGCDNNNFKISNESTQSLNGSISITKSTIDTATTEFYIDPLDIVSPYYYADSCANQLSDYTNVDHENGAEVVEPVYTEDRPQTDLSKYYQIAF